MNELIAIVNTDFSGSLKNGVNARELHAFLESRQDFSTWIKNRIADYDFVENQDFVKLHKKMELSKTGQIAIEYFLSLDMAKELSMVERSTKGKQARQYFIECEKQLSDSLKPALPQTYKAALLELVAQVERTEALEKQISLNAPKVAFAEAVSNTDDVILIRDLAKLLKQNSVDMGESGYLFGCEKTVI